MIDLSSNFKRWLWGVFNPKTLLKFISPFLSSLAILSSSLLTLYFFSFFDNLPLLLLWWRWLQMVVAFEPASSCRFQSQASSSAQIKIWFPGTILLYAIISLFILGRRLGFHIAHSFFFGVCGWGGGGGLRTDCTLNSFFSPWPLLLRVIHILHAPTTSCEDTETLCILCRVLILGLCLLDVWQRSRVLPPLRAQRRWTASFFLRRETLLLLRAA